MKKSTVYILIIVLSIVLLSCTQETPEPEVRDMKVAVAIVPLESFVDEVGGSLVDVVVMIPPGASPANYQPNPQQMVDLSDSSIYFSLGVPAENASILPKLGDMNGDIKLVSLDEIVMEEYPALVIDDHDHGDDVGHEEDEVDPHIWLSPRRAILMVENIRNTLIEADGENQEIYTDNASSYIDKLKNLDQRLQAAFVKLDKKSFIIYHPSYGYFADDYGLEMVTVEENGKEATVDRLKDIIDFARDKDIRVIFYQEEFDSSQAATIAREIDGIAVEVSPLSYDYIEAMEDILEKLESVLK